MGRVSLNVFLLILLNDILDTSATLAMKKGGGNFNSFYLWIGAGIYIFNFLVWMKILTKADLSVALPLASASYVLVPFMSVLFLHEHVGPLRWIAILLIILGIFFVSQAESHEQGESLV